MAATIKIRRSTTAGAVPSSLVTGEIAINEADGALYYRNSSGTVTRFLAPQQGVTYSSQATSSLVGRTVLLSNSSPATVTLDASSSIPTGSTIYFVRTGSGAVMFAAGSGGVVYASPNNTMSALYSTAMAVKISATDWAVNILSTTYGAAYGTGTFAADSLLTIAQSLLTSSQSTPLTAGALTINNLPLGNMDYVVKQGNQTVSSFVEADWFTSTQDTASAWVIVNGSLTINSGVTFTPSNRKLFTAMYINGNLTLDGAISMSLKGANHSGTGTSGGATTAQAIRIATGTWGAYTNPTITAAGGGGGATSGGAGSASAFSTSGGGAGTGTGGFGFGAAGTCFCGGAGGGGATPSVAVAASGGANGGAGGSGNGAPGGGGNPAGSPTVSGTESGSGGTLVIFVKGTVYGSGVLRSRGGNVLNTGYAYGGGGSGGGLVVLMCTAMAGSPYSIPTFSLAGGTSTGASTTNGGAGGAGTGITITGL